MSLAVKTLLAKMLEASSNTPKPEKRITSLACIYGAGEIYLALENERIEDTKTIERVNKIYRYFIESKTLKDKDREAKAFGFAESFHTLAQQKFSEAQAYIDAKYGQEIREAAEDGFGTVQKVDGDGIIFIEKPSEGY